MPQRSYHLPPFLLTAIERIWHMSDSQALILALAVRSRSLKPFKLFSRAKKNAHYP